MSTNRSSTFSYFSASTSLFSTDTINATNTSISAEPRIYPSERYRGVSCLAVGAGAGGSINMLARVTIVDYWGNEMLDTFVRPTESVIDYRTAYTNITEEELNGPRALPFDIVQTKVTDLISGYIIVGHTLWNDLSVLGICHLAINTRDTALYLPFKAALKQESTPRLPTLVWTLMERYIQGSTADSAENARASMDLFRSTEHDWEQSIFEGNWPCALPPAGHKQPMTFWTSNLSNFETSTGVGSVLAIKPTIPPLRKSPFSLHSRPRIDNNNNLRQASILTPDYCTMELATNEVSKIVVNLADLCQTQENFIDKASRNAHIDKQHAWAMGNTVQTLMLDLGPPNACPYFAVPALTLVPPQGPLPESEALKQTYDLVCACNSFAQRCSIGSLLAGPGSESDEFADVGFWCGEIDESNKEFSILQSLSLDQWVQKGTITRLDDAPLITLRKSEMWELCEALTDLTEFRVERPDAGGRIIHVMAGKGLKGWCGLIGVGIWSDE